MKQTNRFKLCPAAERETCRRCISDETGRLNDPGCSFLQREAEVLHNPRKSGPAYEF